MIHPHAEFSAKDVSAHYNDLDPFYRAIWSDHVHHGLWRRDDETKNEAVRNLVHEVALKSGIKAGSTVCDVGCGYGATSRLLADEYGAGVLGLTISKAQHKHGNSQLKKHPVVQGKVELLCMDWLKNPLENSRFDHVISIESSEHMMDIEKFFTEAYRVLKPGGSFVICAWLSKPKPSHLERRLLLEPICLEGRLAGLGTAEDYQSLYQSSGFEFESFEDVTHSVKKTWSISILGSVLHFMRKPSDLRFLSSKLNPNRDFVKSLFRIRMAYELGTMKYGILKGTKKQ